METYNGVLDVLVAIEDDNSVPKHIRTKIADTIKCLKGEPDAELDVCKDKALQNLDEISNDPNMPSFTRTQLWGVISALESE